MGAEQVFRILYIEDDPGAGRLFQRRLERSGYKVDLAADGYQGLAMLEQEAYDVVAVDHDMPGLSGLEVIKRLAREGRLPPTIMVTGAGNENVAVEAMKLGASDYIIKDVGCRYLDLVHAVTDAALSRQRMVREKLRAESDLQNSQQALLKAYEELEEKVRKRTADLSLKNALLVKEIAQREQAEKALKDSQDLLALFSEQLPAIVVIKGDDFRIRSGNRFLKRLFGIYDWSGKTVDELLSPEDARRIRAAEEAALQGKTVTLDLWIREAAGEDRCFEFREFLLQRESGTPMVGCVGVDVTERKRAEKALRESEEKYHSVFEAAKDAILVVDCVTDAVVEANTAACKLYGYTHEELLRLKVKNLSVHWDETDVDRCGGVEEIAIHYHRKKDGTVSPVEIATSDFDRDGRTISTWVIREVSERMRSEERLRESEALYRGLFEHSPIGLWILDLSDTKQFIEGLRETGTDLGESFMRNPEAVEECRRRFKIIDVNRSVLDRYGMTDVSALKRNLDKVFIPETYASLGREFIHLMEGRTSGDTELVTGTVSGEKVNLTMRWVVLPGHEETLSRVVVSTRDVTQYRQALEKLRLSAQLIAASNEAVVVTDAAGNIVEVNDAFCEMTGYSQEEVIGKNPSLMKSDRHDPEFYVEMWKSLRDTGRWQGEVWDRRKNGKLYAKLLSISAVRDEQGMVICYAGFFSDITKMKETEAKLKQMAHYDGLTGLPNRTLFKIRLDECTSLARSTDGQVVLMLLDLDGFKDVNDCSGHSTGDQLLVAVAKRLQKCVRGDDTVARLGGDEFTVVLCNVSDPNVVELVARRILAAVRKKYRIKGISVNISASMGIAVFPDDGQNGEQLLANADTALYMAKGSGKNDFRYFDRFVAAEAPRRAKRLPPARRGSGT
jgi:diguanylate cyclase (GGDEF)-like protein/PAS domain S-box-containing protein